MKPILILKTGKTVGSISPEKGDFEDWIIQGMNEHQDHFKVVSVFLDEILPELDKISAIIITGSAAMVTDRLPWSELSSTFIKQAYEKQVPMLGICYGHQLIAQALGGRVDSHPLGREIGTTVVHLSEAGKLDPLFNNFPERFRVNVSHSQSVLIKPDISNVLAVNDFESHHCLSFGNNTWGVQFHPEFDKEVMLAYLKERKQDIKSEGLDVDNIISEVTETPVSEKLLQNFLNIIKIT